MKRVIFTSLKDDIHIGFEKEVITDDDIEEIYTFANIGGSIHLKKVIKITGMDELQKHPSAVVTEDKAEVKYEMIISGDIVEEMYKLLIPYKKRN